MVGSVVGDSVVLGILKQPCVLTVSSGEALEVYRLNLRLHARNPGRTATFASHFFVILHQRSLTLIITGASIQQTSSIPPPPSITALPAGSQKIHGKANSHTHPHFTIQSCLMIHILQTPYQHQRAYFAGEFSQPGKDER